MTLEEFCGCNKDKTPEVGMKCTICLYSDQNPATVVRVSKSGKTFWIKENKTTADHSKEGGIGHQNWLISEEFQNDYEERVNRRKRGWYTRSGCYVMLGVWRKYYDWSF